MPTLNNDSHVPSHPQGFGLRPGHHKVIGEPSRSPVPTVAVPRKQSQRPCAETSPSLSFGDDSLAVSAKSTAAPLFDGNLKEANACDRPVVAKISAPPTELTPPPALVDLESN